LTQKEENSIITSNQQ